MGLDQMMIWRFRNIEGVLADIASWNLNECKFKDGSQIDYDYKNGNVTVTSKINIDSITETMPLSACTKRVLIDKYGFRERFNNRHNLSYGNEQTN